MKLSVIIPAYNEEKSIITVIENVLAIDLSENLTGFEIVVVDDASDDNTSKLIEDFIQKYSHISLFTHKKNQGKGAAVHTGVKNSTGELIIIQDADLELVPEDIPSMVKMLIKLNIEFINGSRYMPGIIRPLYSYRRFFFNKMFTKLASILINIRLTDLACGYKLFTRQLYNQLSLRENGFGFEAELVIKTALLKKTLIAEVPVQYFPRNIGDGKKIRNIDGILIFWIIFKYGFFKAK